MPNRIEMFRRLERQYFRDRLGTLGLQQLDGMILHLLWPGAWPVWKSAAWWSGR